MKPAPPLLRLPHLFALSGLIALGCTAETSQAEGTGESSSTTGLSATGDELPSSDTSTSGAAADSTSGNATGSSTGDEVVDTSGSSSEDTGGFIPRPDGGFPPAGVCVGISNVGFLSTVHAATKSAVDPTCDPVPAPCEGDIVGEWTIEAHCGTEVLPNFFAAQCPQSVMSVLTSSVQGTRVFNEDLTFSHSNQLVLDVEVVLDSMDCFGIECEAFGNAIDQQDNNFSGACAELESECVCMLSLENNVDYSGTYSVEDAGVVRTTNGNPSGPVPVCADGDRLTMWETLTETRAYPDTLCDDASDCQEALGDKHEQWFCA